MSKDVSIKNNVLEHELRVPARITSVSASDTIYDADSETYNTTFEYSKDGEAEFCICRVQLTEEGVYDISRHCEIFGGIFDDNRDDFILDEFYHNNKYRYDYTDSESYDEEMDNFIDGLIKTSICAAENLFEELEGGRGQ